MPFKSAFQLQFYDFTFLDFLYQTVGSSTNGFLTVSGTNCIHVLSCIHTYFQAIL